MTHPQQLDDELIRAVESRKRKEVERLLAAGANANARKGRKSLFELADQRDHAILAALIRAGAWNKKVQGMVVWAAMEGLSDVVKILLERGADPNAKAAVGTALQVAAERGDLQSLESFLAHGADPDAGDMLATPLLAALGKGHVETAERLLEAGASAQLKAEMGTTTPIAVASALGLTSLVERLLCAGADPNEVCPQVVIERFRSTAGGSQTYPLLVAAERGHSDTVLTLLGGGARLDVRDGEGRSLFELASPEVAEAVRRAGYQALGRPPEEEMLLAAERGDSATVAQLLASGTAPDARDARVASKGCTPLMLAASGGHQECLELLLTAGAGLEFAEQGDAQLARMLANETEPSAYRKDFQNTLGRTALHLSVEKGHTELAVRLLEAGADAHVKDFLGDTPLVTAVENGLLPVLRKAHERGFELQGKGRGKEDMLALACEKGHSEVLRLLLDCREKIAQKDLDQALLRACARCDRQAVLALLNRGASGKAASRESGTVWTAVVGASRYVQVPVDTPQKPGAIRVWNEHGLSILQAYPEEEILAVMDMLRPHGGDLDKEGPLGPPILLAIRAGLAGVVRRLLDWGAKPYPQGRKEAELYGQTELLASLAEWERSEPAPSPPPVPAQREPRTARPPSFARSGKTKAFLKAVDELAETCQGKITPFPSLAGAYLIQVKTSRRNELSVPALQASYGERGYYLVGYGPSLRGPEKLAVFPSPNPYHAMAAIAPAGPNDDVGTGNIIDWFEARESEGLTVCFTAMSHDVVAGRFTSPVGDASRLAELMYELCPDSVEQGAGSLEALADSLAQNGEFYLWWD